MKRTVLMLLASLLAMVSISAQTSLRGKIVSENARPISGAKVTLANQNISTTTNSAGDFALIYLEAMDEELILEADGYMSEILLILLEDGKQNDLGELKMKTDIQKDLHDEIVLNLSEADLNDDEGKSQSMSSGTSASIDVFNNTSSYAWSSARYRGRGYEQTAEVTYINGISFVGAERGTFSYSSIGGLNDASRNKEVVNGIEANNFAFGGIGQATNIQMDATRFAQGWKVGFAAANRNYKGRVSATYASGLLENGWAFAAQVAFRYAPATKLDIIGAGSDYNSFGYFFSAEKRWGTAHKLSLITFGAPTQRGQQAAVTQEVYDLTGSNYYNPYWGYQNGKVRNSREVKAFDPTMIASYEWNIDDKQTFKVGVGVHYSLYSNSALTFFNAPDPRPDYYRNLPSFLWDGQINGNGGFVANTWNGSAWTGISLGANPNPATINGTTAYSIDAKAYNDLTNMWTSRDKNGTQINWDAIYAANYANNIVNPDGPARYMVERRHNDLQEATANFLYNNKKVDHLNITVGFEAKQSAGIHYKTVDDLLGGKQWIDLDPFADRDIKELASNIGLTQDQIELVRQNDVNNKSQVVTKGNKFGYDYTINMANAKLWAQNEWSWNEVELYYGLQIAYSQFSRNTNMLNGRQWYLAQIAMLEDPIYGVAKATRYLGKNYQDVIDGNVLSSYKGYSHTFIDPSFKAGVTYKLDGHNQLKVNALAQTAAPLARDAYISSRVHDRVVENIYLHDNAKNLKDYFGASEKRVSADLTYEFNYPVVRGRITGYFTQFWDGTELNGYYDDEASTFVNQALTGINKRHMGIEAAAAVKCGKYITLTPILALGDFRYTSDAMATTSAENGMALAQDAEGNNIYEVEDKVMMKNLKVASGPQLNSSLKISFFHPKMWFADLTISYFDWSYLSSAPSRRMQGLYTGTRTDNTAVNGSYKDLGIVNTDEEGNILFDKRYGYSALYHDNNRFYALDMQEKLTDPNPWNRIMIDASVGHLMYLKNRQSVSINLSVSNLTNNTHFKTGGYQQARLARGTKQGTRFGNTDNGQSVIGNNVWKYPSKYYYAWGANFFLNVTYKF